MFQKCQVCGILPFEDFPIQSKLHQTRPAWTLRCSLGGTQTLNKSINSTQIPFQKLLKHPPHISTQHKRIKDSIRHQQTPFPVNRNHHKSSNSLFGCQGTSVGVAWCLLISVVVLNCPEITGVGFWEHNNGVCVCLLGLDASKDVYECLGLVWWSKCCILEKLRKAKFHTLDTFETSRYQNRPI